MRGTEKQIAWATEIKERISGILAEGIEEQKQNQPENTSYLEGLTALLDIVSGFDGYAGEMIEVFSNIRRTGDIRQDTIKVVFAARATRIRTVVCGEFGKALRAPFGYDY